MVRGTLIVVLLNLFYVLSYGQSVPPAASFWEQYLVKTLDGSNEIISDEVFWSFESKEGFIWIAGSGGLTRFDGISSKHFNSNNFKELDSSIFYEVQEDSKENLWIPSIGGGILRFSEDSSNVITESDGLSSNIVKTLAITSGDTVWVGTYGAGLNAIYQDSVIASYTVNDGMVGDVIWRLMLDSNNRLWIGTKNGLSIFDGNTFQNFTTETGLPNNAVQGITEMNNGDVWIGTDGGGIVVFKDYNPTAYISKNDGLSNDFPQFFAQNPDDGSIWIATHGGGLDRYHNGEILNFNKEHGLVSDFLTHILFSTNGLIWVSSEDGLSQFRTRKVRTLTQKHGLSLDHVPVLMTAQDGTLWFGTDGKGYNSYKDGKWTYFDVDATNTIGYANSVAENKTGDIWFSTQGNGIFRIKDGRIDQKTSTEQGLSDPTVRALVFDKQENLWAGTNNGLNRLTPSGEITTYNTNEGLPNSFIITLLNSTDDKLLIGTFGGGLAIFDDNTFSVIDTTNGLSGNKVISLFQDSDETIWIGTSNSGLNSYRNGEINSYSTDDGLFSNSISSIIEDDYGNLWFGSGNGIFTVAKSDFSKFDSNELKILRSTNYTIEDGLSAIQLESANNRTITKATDGSILFASTAGVEVIHPSILSYKAQEAKTYINQLIVNDINQDFEENLIINAGSNKLEIQYSAFSFYAPGKTKFRFKMDGIEDEWNLVDKRNIAYYDYLPDGEYTFLVSATNEKEVWSSPASLSIIVLPPFYKTWWFRSIAVLSFAFLISGVVRIQSNIKVRKLNRELAMQHKVQKERERISRDLHDNVGSQITNLITGIEISNLHIKKNEPDKAIDLLKNLDISARGAMTELRESIWLLDQDSVSLKEFKSHFKAYAKKNEYALNGLEIIFEIESETAIGLNPTQSLHLLRILQEALNNCRKYAEASVFKIRINQRSDILDIEISDNGKGMDSEESSISGNGLKNMKLRSQELNGFFKIKSEPEIGTTIHLSFNVIP